jgi:AAT family amino acid transporter/D-serine/D-alanine/glycine transporter
MLIGIFLNYVMPAQILDYALGTMVIIQLWTWGVIIVAHLGFRRAVNTARLSPVPYRLPVAPLTDWLGLGYIALIALFMCKDPYTRSFVVLAVSWFCLLGIGYGFMRRRRPLQGTEVA